MMENESKNAINVNKLSASNLKSTNVKLRQVKSIYSPKRQQKDDVQVSDSERHRSHLSQLHYEH